jgi:small subunit ribosomal protein S7
MKKNKDIYSKFLGSLTKNGKKSVAKRILDSSFIKVSKKENIPAHFILSRILLRLNFFLEIKKIKIRKNTHLVPFPLTTRRQDFLRVKWLLESAKEDSRKIDLSDKIAMEVSNLLLNDKSKSLLKKNFVNKEALSNRSNVHFRW